MPNAKKATKAGSRSAAPDTPNFSKDVGQSLLISLAIAIVLNLAASLVLYFLPDPAPLTRPLGLAASALTALLGGMIAARIHRHAALLCGLANGCAMLAVMLTASLFFKSLASGYSVPVALALHLGFLALTLVGSVIGIHQKPRTSVKRRKR